MQFNSAVTLITVKHAPLVRNQFRIPDLHDKNCYDSYMTKMSFLHNRVSLPCAYRNVRAG